MYIYVVYGMIKLPDIINLEYNRIPEEEPLNLTYLFLKPLVCKRESRILNSMRGKLLLGYLQPLLGFHLVVSFIYIPHPKTLFCPIVKPNLNPLKSLPSAGLSLPEQLVLLQDQPVWNTYLNI